MHPRSPAPRTTARATLVLLSLVWLVVPSGAAAAQDVVAPGQAAGEIRGTVHDSIAGAPLEGATVLLLGTTRSATTGADGSFVLTDVPTGDHRISFFHSRLGEIGLGPASWAVDVPPDDTVRVDLWIPSARTIAHTLCRSEPGVLVGTLREEVDGAPTSGTVVARWSEEARTRSDGSMTDERGRYVLCGLPTDRPVAVSGTREGRGGRVEEVRIPRTGLLVRDVALDFDASATIHGRVVAEDDGSPLEDVEVRVEDVPVAARSSEDGRFRLDGVRPGRAVVELHHLAFGRIADTLTLGPGEVVERTVEVPVGAFELESLEVTAERRHYRGRMEEFERRMEDGTGTFLTREQIAERDEEPIIRIIAAQTPSLRLGCVDDSTREITAASRACRLGLVIRRRMPSLVQNRSASSPCLIQYWIDGNHMGGHFDITTVQPRDVEGIEIYPGPATIPVRFRTSSSACGVVAIWTREPGADTP